MAKLSTLVLQLFVLFALLPDAAAYYYSLLNYYYSYSLYYYTNLYYYNNLYYSLYYYNTLYYYSLSASYYTPWYWWYVISSLVFLF